MSVAFNSGKIPEPLAVGATEPDAAAAEMAQKVALKDEYSTAALVSAFKAAGFSILAEDGSELVGARNAGQGIGFESWEIASIAKLYGDEMHITLADLSQTFSQTLPGFKKLPLSKLLLEGIQADSESKKPELRFWARFIVELGKNANPSYDLMAGDVDPANVKLDAIQFAFITRRLAADLAIAGAKGRKNGGVHEPQQSLNLRSTGKLRNADLVESYLAPRLIQGVFHPASKGPYERAGLQEGTASVPGLPCNLTEAQLQLMDVIAYGFGFAFDRLMEMISVPGFLTEGLTGAVEGYAKFNLIANAIFVYGKLVFTSMTANATISMNSPPLVRQIDPVAGCQRKLTGTIIQKTGNWQLVNCLRMALLHAGIDVSLPKDGPIAGAKTQWHIVEGGANVTQAGAAGYNDAIVEWTGNGPRIQDAGTYAGIPGIVGGTAVSDFSQPVTSEDGTVEISIEGTRRRESLQGWAVPVMKTAKVQLTFAAKPPYLRGDLIDALGGAAGLLSGPIGLLTTAPVEMLLRSRWFASPVYAIPVKDWKACNGGWVGKIRYEITSKATSSTTHVIALGPEKGKTCTENKSQNGSDSSEWDLNGSTVVNGLIQSSWSGERQFDATTEGCFTQRNTTSGRDQGIGKVQISIGDGVYFLGMNAGGSMNPNAVTYTEVRSGDGSHSTSKGPLVPIEAPPVSGKLDPDDPNHLVGRQNLPNSVGGVTTLEWDLQVCGRVGDVCAGQN